MRRTTAIGIALIIVGTLIGGISSGAFDVTTADRGTTVSVATDPNAYLGIEKPDELGLADGDLTCGDIICFSGYRSYDVEIATFTDQTPPPELTVTGDDVSLTMNGDGNPSLEEWTLSTTETGYSITGEVRCETIFGGQQHDSGNLTIDIKTSDGTITIDLERVISVQCE